MGSWLSAWNGLSRNLGAAQTKWRRFPFADTGFAETLRGSRLDNGRGSIELGGAGEVGRDLMIRLVASTE